MDAYIGEVRLFCGAFVPQGWLACDGSSYQAQQYQALYAVIGNLYGGSPPSTFNVPNMMGKVPMGTGQGSGLTARTLGQSVGSATTSLTQANMPMHDHPAQCVAGTGGSAKGSPIGGLWASQKRALAGFAYYAAPVTVPSTTVQMSDQAISPVGSALPHNNMQPYQTLMFIINWDGEFPVSQ